MKKVNNCWVDEHNNKWDCEYYTEEQAKEYSKSLIDCNDCNNCSDCSHCSYCSDCNDCSRCNYCSCCSRCRDCSYCGSCSGCSYSSNCNYCNYCGYCSDCSCCRDCRRCKDCNHCDYCSDCDDCNNFEDNPQRYTTNRIGSRDDNTTIYWLGDNVQVMCGCFRGNIEQWEEAINTTHKDNEKYLNEYLKQVKIVRNILGMNKGE